jgi:hypothetical protein
MTWNVFSSHGCPDTLTCEEPLEGTQGFPDRQPEREKNERN